MEKTITVLTLCSMLFALGSPAAAQQPKKVPRIGLLRSGWPADPNVEAFRQGLRELGYIEGKNIAIEYRHAEGKDDRIPDLAAELVRLKVDIIVVGGGTATSAAKKATSTIPIVITSASDPVGAGLVASLAKPGGNITGSTLISPELSGKRLELLKEAVPGVSRMGVLIFTANPAYALLLKETEAAAQSLGLQLQILEVRGSNELESAFGVAKRGRSEAMNVLSSALFSSWRKDIVDLAARNRLPAVYYDRLFPEAGGLMSYGPNLADLYRRAAVFVDKIVKGAKPADLPVEQPTKFEFVINLKTAKQLGLIIPQTVLYRADKVIK
jgi:putative tryptophan/tyrosine transport system substrate-binding protein